MATLDTLTIRFEADAEGLMRDLDALETRLDGLSGADGILRGGVLDLQARLNVVSDDAIAASLQTAGETLARAVEKREVQAAAAIEASRNAMTSALRSAANDLAASLHITVPLTVDGYRLGVAAIRGINRVTAAQGGATTI